VRGLGKDIEKVARPSRRRPSNAQIHPTRGARAPRRPCHVDTDAIIPKQFLKSIKRSGFGQNLFDEWRYLDHGEPGQDRSQEALESGLSCFNQPRYRGAAILLTRDNFAAAPRASTRPGRWRISACER